MNQPKLIIPRDIYDKVMHWVFAAKHLEISGLGKCEFDPKTNTFKVVDARVLQQSMQTSGNTEITAEAIGKFMYDTRDTGSVIWWWHSHHSMGAFWSGTDRECIKSFAKEGGVVATVFNNKFEYLSACEFKVTSMIGDTTIFQDKLETSIVTYYDEALFKQWGDEYEAAKIKYTTVNHYSGGHYPADRPQPPKRLVKLWNQIPEEEREKYIFEDPSNLSKAGRINPDWTWRKYLKEYSPAHDGDYKDRDLIEHDMVKAYIKDLKKLPLWPSREDKSLISQTKSLWGLSDMDWDALTIEEKEYYTRESFAGGCNA